MRQVAIQPLLAQIKGPTAQFQGVQQVAIEAIIGGAPWTLTVMDTSGEKSMIFMIPAT
jgi:superfamily II DNA helicase RecQ